MLSTYLPPAATHPCEPHLLMQFSYLNLAFSIWKGLSGAFRGRSGPPEEPQARPRGQQADPGEEVTTRVVKSRQANGPERERGILLPERNRPLLHASGGIDDPRWPGVGRARDGDPLLDRAQLEHGEVLAHVGGVAVPDVLR